MGQRPTRALLLCCLIGFFLLASFNQASAIPSFARQTGMECSDCHTVFPELTPLGRDFKLGGYVQSESNKPYVFPPPLAAVAQFSYTGARGLTNGVAPFDSDNRATDKTNLPQALSIFYGGKIYGRLGAFIQATYDGVGNSVALDNTDIRFASKTAIGGKDLTFGLTVNNNPTVQDVWNSTPAWGFPPATSAVANTPAAGTVIDGALAQQVGGIGAYFYWNRLLYVEGTVYRTTLNGITEPLGAGTSTDTVVHGAVPYWRLALQQQWNEHSLSVGTYGLVADIFPGGINSGPTDKFTDIALDAQYQYISKKHRFSLQTTWIHEKQNWDASFPDSTANPSDTLRTFRANANYYYRSSVGDVGGSVAYFSTTGDTDPTLYSPGPISGSGTGSPNSNGFVLQADYLPWKYSKLSLQYIYYNKFNGAHSNYDGFGTNASFNNTIYLLAWFAF
jgi:hypothetical protein